MSNTITFDFDYNHNIFTTLTPYYPYITNIIYNNHPDNNLPTISITFINSDILTEFKLENHL